MSYRDTDSLRPRSPRALALAAALCVATAALVWFGYDATQQSAQRARLLLDRHVREQLALLWAGLTQDMKGAHATVLVPLAITQPPVEPPYDLAEAFARGFARFPYPESFFIWRGGADDGGVTYIFNRADRLPRWHGAEPVDVPYPVVVLRNPAPADVFVSEARRRAGERPSAMFDVTVEDTRYQVVVSYQYHSEVRDRLTGIVGFTVNLDWIRARYFAELTAQIARIGGLSDDVSLAIADEAGRVVTSTRPESELFAPVQRSFPLSFADGTVAAVAGPPLWTAKAIPASNSQLAAAVVGVNDGFVVMAVAAVALVVGLVLTLRGVRAAVDVARMKSDFVTTVTHDLKTPLTVIQLLADTLARGRYDSKEAARSYAIQLSRECSNLSALIDHLMTYARLAHGRHAYTFEATDPAELLDEVVERFAAVLAERGFALQLVVPPDMPPVWADRGALLQAIDNLVDNAVKHSVAADGSIEVEVEATAPRRISITVIDHGVGIDADEIDRVCDRFFRGRNATARGSGLGLAIARQIAQDHGGDLTIQSSSGRGTRARLVLPAAETA